MGVFVFKIIIFSLLLIHLVKWWHHIFQSSFSFVLCFGISISLRQRLSCVIPHRSCVFLHTHSVKIPLKIPKLTRTKTYGLFAMHNRREMRCTEQSKRNIRSAELKTLTAVELYWATKIVETRVPKTTFSVQYVYSKKFNQTRFYRNEKHGFS